MNAGIKFYPAKMIMRSRNDGTLRYTDLWSFRSSKSHKRYIVEVEHFDSHFFGVKFYWKGVMKCTKASSISISPNLCVLCASV